MKNDPVNHPSHYCSHPSGVECIQITEHMSFNLGNTLKYVWRADLKNDGLEDLRKARFYLDREIALRLAAPHRHTLNKPAESEVHGFSLRDHGVKRTTAEVVT